MIDPNGPGLDAPATRDKPWLMRTYAGHSSARESNALFRRNLAKGQTGLSVAFDLPTQTGYDSDHPQAKGEVGKVGVPISHLGDMRALMHGIPLAEMNTSMTINATAAWLMAPDAVKVTFWFSPVMVPTGVFELVLAKTLRISSSEMLRAAALTGST